MQIDDRRERALRLFREGTRLSAAGRLEEGNRLLEGAIQADPTFVPAYCNRAMNHVLSGELELAAGLYEAARDLDPEDPVPWAGLGAVEAERGRDEEAIRVLSHALELGHPGAEVRSNLAYVLDRWGDTERAIALWQEAHELEPSDAAPVAALGDRLDLRHDEAGRPFALGRFQRYDLYRHLDERGAGRCGHDFRVSVGWALSRGISTLSFLHHLRKAGVACDCETALAYAESQDGAYEFARATALVRAAAPERMASALAEAGATLVDELVEPTAAEEDDPESWPTQFVVRGDAIVLPWQPGVGSRLFRLLDQARIALGPGGWCVAVLRSTSDLLAPMVWLLEERRALEIPVDLVAVEDGTTIESSVRSLPPMEPSTFHIQALPALAVDPETVLELSSRHGLARSVSTLGDWTLVGGRVDDEERSLLAFLADLVPHVRPGERLTLRWSNRGALRAAWIERGRLRVFRLEPRIAGGSSLPEAALEFVSEVLAG